MGKGPSINHMVISVRDLDASHRFYTDVLGFEQCGEMTHTLKMRFYRGSEDSHHDLALAETGNPSAYPPPGEWNLIDMPPGINHIAIGYPDRETWLERLKHIRAAGVDFKIRGNHGMTHSAYITDPDGNGIEVLYEVPAEVWEGDVDAALNYFEFLPTDGDAAFEDTTDYTRFGPDQPKAEAVEGRIVARID